MRKFLTTGLFSAILGIVIGGAPADAALVSRGFLDEALENYATTTALDLKADNADLTNLSNIVGTPAELTYRDIMLSGEGMMVNLMGLPYYNAYRDNTVPTNNISELINLNYTDTDFPGLAGVVHSLFWPRDRDDFWQLRLADIFNDYGNLHDMGRGSFTGLIINGGTLTLPDSDITVYGLKDLTTKVDANTAKIGTLPTTMDRLTENNTTYLDISDSPQIALPETVGEQLNYIFNHAEAISNEAAIYSLPKISQLLSLIINGTYKDKGMILDYGTWYKFRNLQVLTSDIDTINTNIGTVPDGQTVVGLINDAKSTANTAKSTATTAKNTADSAVEKIGTLPTEYATVGAALTAIKGIAEDAKAAALSAIPDPKAEGSTGKFVLTVDIVGDNATYRWEKIDREGEITTTTE